jgi:polysaccharide pyruvyl transferase WcaK-like protein
MKVLVYGWYHQLNIGDELFVDAFRKLFPDFQFTFHEKVSVKNLEGVDAVFFGGGSFLLGKPEITEDALKIIKTKPIFYIGVGVESDIHPLHMELIALAKLIATRSPDQVDRLKSINTNVMWIPDLVYSLQNDVQLSNKLNRSVLVLPNISVVPNHLHPYWMHASWNHFKSEFSQFLDVLVQEGYKLDFLSMCRGHQVNDDWAGGEIISHMTRRGKYLLKDQSMGIGHVTSVISQYSLVITQRFHGIVLAEMTRTPYIALHHHDKLKFTQPRNGYFLSYYSCSKQLLIDSFDQTIKMKFTNALPIESDIYKTLVERVRSLL